MEKIAKSLGAAVQWVALFVNTQHIWMLCLWQQQLIACIVKNLPISLSSVALSDIMCGDKNEENDGFIHIVIVAVNC